MAIDWSGRARDPERFIWIAEVRDGELVFLQDGFSRERAIRWLTDAVVDDAQLVAGLDFSFSLPDWYCRQQGWNDGPAVWAAMAQHGEQLLSSERPPFWGRTRPRPPQVAGPRGLRRTEREDIAGAKSTFQIGGAGAVGTGSIRGMPWLSVLAGAGFSVWPMHGRGLPMAIEIYPRAMYGPGIVKRRRASRESLLAERFAEQPAQMLEQAAGCEDAFDAAVSALVMAGHEQQLRSLTADPAYGLEGRAWTPATGL